MRCVPYTQSPMSRSGQAGFRTLRDLQANKQHRLPVLHVDSLLTRPGKASPSEADDETPPFIRGNGIFAGDLSLTFFSETRLQSLASCLRNNKVNELAQTAS
ncbi:hypothetical protein HYQ46_000593 [Verticillium longisporum]|nr:hypothetical protein HYQ46_000593 [Verticillium longisporum]